MRRLVLFLTLWLAPAASAAPLAGGECVILLHGLWRTELSMLAVAWRLEDAGYTVANITYPSLTHPIEELAEMAVGEGLAECHGQSLQRIHFVTHSLGGILLRQYLAEHEIAGLERAVMLGPPNQGSQLAEYLYSLDILQPLQPVPVGQLGTGENSVPLQLGPVEFEVGVIAGNISRRPPLPGFPDEASDGTVSVEETRVAGMVDFIEMGATHTLIMWNTGVLDQVVHFLQNGQFDHRPMAPAPQPRRGPRRY
ncbi:alpha/beta hydrolase [Mangrovimicrobium sediminis]|uniref:Alpha/beta hydrolase n=1 Tax=Mangrovimicrobium sediminis TaxID=2562682 RepID=A0A4Z0LVH4_9GAMM|nr:alpha/beta fold hydrolase [Haliea sp. SAOS-164]TGD71116.1 alpha/beta hydrolase [Haliea sp. SAOS-164]